MEQKLYRVVRQHVYDGGCGDQRPQGPPDVLYCGYDRLEAVRVYYANPSTGTGGPGNYRHDVKMQSKMVSDGQPVV